ncbi:ABC transporter substrate-binding protein [Spirochaetia bacterium]|nr:ABC transporter substrate-binding protein [Spirochaetia bacterium]
MSERPIAILILLAAILAPAYAQDAPRTITATGITMRGTPKYKPGFTHFDYVNPNAPKGGAVTLAIVGTYDSFHRYAMRGDFCAGWEYFYDTLMTGSDDETDALYPLIARSVEYAADYSFIIFSINPAAKDQEGQPITAEDAAYSFNLFYEMGVPQFRIYYKDVRATVLPGNRLRFDLPGGGDKEKMLSLCQTTVFPKRFWEGRDFSEPLNTPPIGTGAYRVGEYRMGQYMILDRVEDYWAADLPVNKGQYNFDHIRYDYYRDANVAFEAFKAGEYDFHWENSAMNWAKAYTGKLFDSGEVLREEIPHSIPQSTQCMTFNTEREVFKDRRVRMALNYFFDFQWMNKNLFYNAYTRIRSYFTNTDYAATALPQGGELAILEAIRDKIPPEVFTKEFNPPVTDGTGFIRNQMREALALFNAAGWELKGGKLINRDTGKQMSFELLIWDSERFAVSFQRNLARFGIDLKIRLVDGTQFLNRMHEGDYDILNQGYLPMPYPDSSTAMNWHSEYIDSTYNLARVKDPALDYLVEGVMASQEDEASLRDWGRALDRVLTWNHYIVPQWYGSTFRLAYHKKFRRPPVMPKYSYGFNAWWVWVE